MQVSIRNPLPPSERGLTKVIVHYNINKGGWVISRLKGSVGRGLKICDASAVLLKDVQFHTIVGTQRSIAAGAHKSVHAWAIGTIVEGVAETGAQVTYRPRISPDFVADGAKLTHGALVAFAADNKAYLANPAR